MATCRAQDYADAADPITFEPTKPSSSHCNFTASPPYFHFQSRGKKKAIKMIKRRFYRFEHGNRDDASESSSSSDDSEVEGEATDETDVEEEEDDEVVEEEEKNISLEVREKEEASSSSGYESEDSSANEVNLDSSGLPTSDDDVAAQNGEQNIVGSLSSGECNTVLATAQHSPEKDGTHFDATDCVLKRKSVFKCKLCPRIVILSEDSLKTHLNSKRHARSEKLLKEGRLKLMLNDNGQIEGDTSSDDDATTVISKQESPKPKKKRPWKKRRKPRQKTKFRKARRLTDEQEKTPGE